MAPQGRMRGEFAVVSRLWVIMANLPLISQRAGPLTASPEGEAFPAHKKTDAVFTASVGFALLPCRQGKHKPAPFALLALGVDLPA